MLRLRLTPLSTKTPGDQRDDGGLGGVESAVAADPGGRFDV